MARPKPSGISSSRFNDASMAIVSPRLDPGCPWLGEFKRLLGVGWRQLFPRRGASSIPHPSRAGFKKPRQCAALGNVHPHQAGLPRRDSSIESVRETPRRREAGLFPSSHHFECGRCKTRGKKWLEAILRLRPHRNRTPEKRLQIRNSRPIEEASWALDHRFRIEMRESRPAERTPQGPVSGPGEQGQLGRRPNPLRLQGTFIKDHAQGLRRLHS